MSTPAPPSAKRLPKLLWVPIATAGVVMLMMAIYGAGILTGQLKVFSIPTKAMSPTLDAGDSIFATKFKPKTGGLSRGQCVVFDASGLKEPSGTKLSGWWVKRIVALPGDTVSIVDGAMRVNDVLVERNGGSSIAPLPVAIGKLPVFPITVPPGQVFVLGDNYRNSLDSRYIGPVSIDRIKYRPLYRVSPADRAGKIE